ncbi:MAG: hypothetical protein EOO94_00410 [Pedobacter sp.]|nr:MAG: hypothetical protein EOO94_00410 [Pedobacter sp.]
MKKLLALTLLIVHLFNLTGYTFLFSYLERQSSRQITSKIDQQKYNEDDLVEIKVALNLPYVNSWGDYQLHEGEITINGNHHNYVKRKVSGDTLYLLCLPNRDKDEIQIAESKFAADANDLGTRSDKKEIKKAEIFSQYQVQDITYSIPPVKSDAVKSFPIITSPIADSYINKHPRPPRACS